MVVTLLGLHGVNAAKLVAVANENEVGNVTILLLNMEENHALILEQAKKQKFVARMAAQVGAKDENLPAFTR